jgi:hypothetical protein
VEKTWTTLQPEIAIGIAIRECCENGYLVVRIDAVSFRAVFAQTGLTRDREACRGRREACLRLERERPPLS